MPRSSPLRWLVRWHASTESWRWVVAATLLGCITLGAKANDNARTDQVDVRLLASHTQVIPGQRLQVGIQQAIAPHWHTYWVNPGDSGMATQASWRLPEGWQAGDIRWPVPQRFDIGPITNHGYEQSATLLVDIAVPDNATIGQVIDVQVDLSWLVCKEVCIPQQAQLSVPIAVSREAEVDTANQAALQQAAQRLPQPPTSPIELLHTPKGLLIGLPEGSSSRARVQFFADTWGVTQHNAQQVTHVIGDRVWLLVPHGEDAKPVDGRVAGILKMGDVGLQVTADLKDAPAAWLTGLPWDRTEFKETTAPGSTHTPFEWRAFCVALALAFLGGIVLNLMPCVFPVLSIKALSLLQHPERSRADRLRHGGAYTVGVVLSFVALAGILLALKATGLEIGWGFQFQEPAFVLLLAALLFAVGLNLLGVFEVGQSLTGVGSGLAEKEGLAGSFFTGVLATVVATPCTAPFMASAVGYALTQPASVVLTVFTALGLGLAAPYLLLSGWPALQRRLPRPGPWMLRFKQALAFPMFASVVWLVWVLAQQSGPDGVAVSLSVLLVAGLAAWVLGSSQQSSGAWPRLGRWITLGLVAAAFFGGWQGLTLTPPAHQTTDATAAEADGNPTKQAAGSGAWQPFSQARLEALRAEGKPVFVNFTAAWCITCLVNERTALSQDRVKAAFNAQGVTYLKGDWTHQNPEITRVLAEHGRSGVPLYLFFPAGQGTPASVLPQVLTPDIVIAAVKAGSAVPRP